MGVVDAVAVQDHRGMGVNLIATQQQLLKPAQKHPQYVTGSGGQRPVTRKYRQARPWDGYFETPASIDIAVVVEGAVDTDGGFQARQIESGKCPARTPGMCSAPEVQFAS